MLKYFLLLVFIVFGRTAYAQTPSQILNDYYRAIGGKARIDSVKSAVIKGNLSNQYTSSAFISKLKRGYKYRAEFSHNDGRSSVYCYNGSEYTGTNKLAISMMKDINREHEPFLLFNKVLFYPQAELKAEAEEIVKGIKCKVLSFLDKGRNKLHKFFFDSETHLLFAEGSSNYPIFYENYQSTEGILFPMRMKHTVEIMDTITEYTEIILNPELPDDIFDCNPE